MEKYLIIIPCYNEGKSIKTTLKALRDFRSQSGLPLDFLVVNDGSKDNTLIEAKKMNSIVLDLPVNLGIGGAVQAGFLYAFRNGYKAALQFDGDGQHIASEIPKILNPILEKKANAVIGSRFLGAKSFRSTFTRRIGIQFLSYLTSLLIRQKISDPTSGFRAYDVNAIRFFAKNYPDDYPEPSSLIILKKTNMKILETPALMKEREEGNSSIKSFDTVYYMLKVSLVCLFNSMKDFEKHP